MEVSGGSSDVWASRNEKTISSVDSFNSWMRRLNKKKVEKLVLLQQRLGEGLGVN